jgi:hypothetical protein
LRQDWVTPSFRVGPIAIPQKVAAHGQGEGAGVSPHLGQSKELDQQVQSSEVHDRADDAHDTEPQEATYLLGVSGQKVEGLDPS